MASIMINTRAVAAAAMLAATLSSALPAVAADAPRGQAVYASQCAMCHSPAKGGPAMMGPPLFGVVGRKAGSAGGYDYSPWMKTAGFSWTNSRLHAFLPAPREMAPGTKMPYGGLKDATQLDDLIAYLDTLK